MKKILVLGICILISGCVSKDPNKDNVQEGEGPPKSGTTGGYARISA